jgi:hypothetical protein
MNWMVVVAGFTAVWALALSVASAIRMMKQNQTPGEAICARTAMEAVVRVEDLIFVPFPSGGFSLGINFN